MTKPSELTRDQWAYKGWQIYFDMPPIPSRDFDWVAQCPGFEPDYDGETGNWSAGEGQVHAATYEELLEEIEAAIAAEEAA